MDTSTPIAFDGGAIRESICRAGLAFDNEIVGCTDDEIGDLERCHPRPLPFAYRQFMREAGKHAGYFMHGEMFFYPEVKKAVDIASELLTTSDGGSLLTHNHIVFYQHEGYDIYLMDCLQDDVDPPVFRYDERSDSLRMFTPAFSQCLRLFIVESERLSQVLRPEEIAARKRGFV